MATLTTKQVLSVASNLLSGNGENPEYDRAIVEMVIDLIGGTSDDKELVLQFLRAMS